MAHTFTLDDLAKFAQEEKELSRQLGLIKPEETPVNFSPDPQTVSNILNYSKALSVRKTERFGTVEMILN